MDNNTQIRGVISYLIRLTHTSGAFRFKFVNVDVFKKIKGQQSYPEIHYDLEITSKQSDIPYLWDFFHCKSFHYRRINSLRVVKIQQKYLFLATKLLWRLI